jgi:hypothetical protein
MFFWILPLFRLLFSWGGKPSLDSDSGGFGTREDFSAAY